MAKNIYLTPDDLKTVIDHGTTIEVTGTELHTNARVTFAGDHRPMSVFLEVVAREGDDDHFILVEEWAILRRIPATMLEPVDFDIEPEDPEQLRRVKFVPIDESEEAW